MWHERCTHCGRAQLFGVHQVVAVAEAEHGAVSVTWRCPNCRGHNRLLTGRRSAPPNAA